MTIGLLKEPEGEHRVALLPESVKSLISLEVNVWVESQAGNHAFVSDTDFEKSGAKISQREEVLKADLILGINPPTSTELETLKAEQVLVCVFQPLSNKDLVERFLKLGITSFSMDNVPRTTRAQAMDILSSMATVAGYKAVLMAASHSPRFFPMFMTAAGSIIPSKVLVLGAGVAGLQAIATAKRMGAIVFATDVRAAAKEQVESLGGKFLIVEGAENLETEGGYAKEASEEFKQKQENLLKETLKKIDIVICTALIPGKKAPLIIKKDMIEVMQTGSVIYDLAASQGGNSEFTKVNEIIDHNGVKIMGDNNILNKLPNSASNLYAKNMFNFVSNLYDKENKKININLEDEIIEKTQIK